jgi:hypothetical protein
VIIISTQFGFTLEVQDDKVCEGETFHLEVFNEAVEVETDASEQLLDELVALAWDAGDLGDVRADLRLDNTETVLGFLPLLGLGQVQLQEAPQLVSHDACPAKWRKKRVKTRCFGTRLRQLGGAKGCNPRR